MSPVRLGSLRAAVDALGVAGAGIVAGVAGVLVEHGDDRMISRPRTDRGRPCGGKIRLACVVVTSRTSGSAKPPWSVASCRTASEAVRCGSQVRCAGSRLQACSLTGGRDARRARRATDDERTPCSHSVPSTMDIDRAYVIIDLAGATGGARMPPRR